METQKKAIYKLAHVWAAVLNYDPYKIIEYYFEGVKYEKPHIVFLCPFHPDTSPSMKFTPEKNLWKCFACGAGGSGIVSLMHRYFKEVLELPMPKNKDKMDRAEENWTVLRIAADMGIINAAQYEAFSKEKYSPSTEKSDVSMKTEHRKKAVKRADPDVINNVYRAMAAVCGLSDKHKDHLLHERKLSEEDLKNFFTFPKKRQSFGYGITLPKAIVDYLCDRLCDRKYNIPFKDASKEEKRQIDNSSFIMKVKEQLPYVPGFFFRKVSKVDFQRTLQKYSVEEIDDKMTKRMNYTFVNGRKVYGFYDYMSYSGIGILNSDERAWTSAIEIRKDKLKGKSDSRYVRFSSEFEAGKEDIIGGTSPGSPGGIIFPKRPGMSQMCITEGRFKAEKIADKGNMAVYLTGVNNWKPVISIIQNVQGCRGKVFLMFDSDVLGNVSVHAQLLALAKELLNMGITPYVILWAKANGKGFDDLCNNKREKYVKYLKCVPFLGNSKDSFEFAYKDSYLNTLRHFQIERPEQLKRKEERQNFNASLQKNLEERFRLKKDEI